jgi:hypothetical protein
MPEPTQAVQLVQPTKATPVPGKRGRKPGSKNVKTIEPFKNIFLNITQKNDKKNYFYFF